MSARISRDFKANEVEQARELIAAVDLGSDEAFDGVDRIQAALLIEAHGNLERLLDAAALAETDWRDLLVNAGLENEDWPSRVTSFLGPVI